MVLLAHQEQLALILHLAHEVKQSTTHDAVITDALESAVGRIGHDLQVSLAGAVERVLEEVVEAIRIAVGEVSGSARRLESSSGRKLAEIRDELHEVVKLLNHAQVPSLQLADIRDELRELRDAVKLLTHALSPQVPTSPQNQVDQVDENQVEVDERRPNLGLVRTAGSVLDDLEEDDER